MQLAVVGHEIAGDRNPARDVASTWSVAHVMPPSVVDMM
jgi:hypothetical protein